MSKFVEQNVHMCDIIFSRHINIRKHKNSATENAKQQRIFVTIVYEAGAQIFTLKLNYF